MENLPDDFAIPLGRMVYLGGRVEMLLNRFLTPAGAQPTRLGLSGTRLVKELRKVVTAGEYVEQIVDGYAAMHERRNVLAHGSHQYENGVLWTWHEPTGAKGNAAFSYQTRLTELQDFAQSWQNLADAAQTELDHRAPSTANAE